MAMGIASCMACIIFLILEVIRSRKVKLLSPIMFFYAIWGVICFLSLFGLYELERPSDMAYMLLIIMFVSFYEGSVIADRIPDKKKKMLKDLKRRHFIDRFPFFKNVILKNAFLILCTISIIFCIVDSVPIISEYLKGTEPWRIRNWVLEPYGSNNPIQANRTLIGELFRTTIVAATKIYAPICFCQVTLKRRKNKKDIASLILSALLMTLSIVVGAGARLLVVNTLIYFALTFYAYHRDNKIKLSKKQKILIGLIVGTCLVTIAICTIMRTGFGNILKQAYLYFAVPPTLLSLWLPKIAAMPYTFGLTTFFGLHSYGFRFLETVGLGSLVPEIYNESFNRILISENYLTTGPNMIHNAFVTPVYYFMSDGGILFIIIASLLLGLIVAYSYSKIRNRTDNRAISVYLIIINAIFTSFMHIATANPSYIISLLIIVFLFTQKATIESEINDRYVFNNANEIAASSLYRKKSDLHYLLSIHRISCRIPAKTNNQNDNPNPKTETRTKPHYIYLDILNIVAVLALILMHVNGEAHYFSNTNTGFWAGCLIAECVGYFAVPLFIMVIGAKLMNYRERYGTKIFLKKHLLALLIPMIFWITFAFIDRIFVVQSLSIATLRDFLNALFGSSEQKIYYFLFELIGIYLTMPLLSRLTKKEYRKTLWYIVGIFFIFNALIPNLLLLAGIQWYNTIGIEIYNYIIYVILGYLLSTEKKISKKLRIIIYLLGIAAIVYRYITTYFLSIEAGRLMETTWGFTQFHTIILTCAVFLFFKNIFDYESQAFKKIAPILAKISSCSFGIYVLHLYVRRWIISGTGLDETSWSWKVFGALVVYGATLVMILIVKKIPLLKKVVA